MAHLKYELNQRMAKWTWSTESFQKKILLPEDGDEMKCYEWTGSTGPNGPLFGVYIVDPVTGKRTPRMVPARRVMFAEHFGYWPAEDQSVYHGCGNRSCMNGNHISDFRPSEDVYKNYRAQNGE